MAVGSADVLSRYQDQRKPERITRKRWRYRTEYVNRAALN
jgi:hypothetical protein